MLGPLLRRSYQRRKEGMPPRRKPEIGAKLQDPQEIAGRKIP